MKTTFIFLLTVWSADEPHHNVFLIDGPLTGEECIQKIIDYDELNPEWSLGVPSCEME